MEIQYKAGIIPSTEEIIAVYESSTIKRPTNDSERITAMYKNSNLVVTAWDGEELVGISRSITDFHYCCYLSDLAVKMKYQHQGIGKKLIAITKEKLGPQVMLLLLAAPAAVDYYPKIGMEKFDHAFMIHREK
ncbi:MAG: GNAT family N-acetyltransferase [Pelobium sp.]